MGNIFTSFHPETGEPTKEHEYANSWKWKYSPEDFKKEDYEEAGRTKALTNKYWLDARTPAETVFKYHSLTEEKEYFRNHYTMMSRKAELLLEVIESAALQKKETDSRNKKQKKLIKEFKKGIESYLQHKSDCMVTTMKIVGRIRTKTKCNCGLQQILDKS